MLNHSVAQNCVAPADSSLINNDKLINNINKSIKICYICLSGMYSAKKDLPLIITSAVSDVKYSFRNTDKLTLS